MSDPSDTITLYEKFQQLWAELDPTLKKYREEAKELRSAAGTVEHNESLPQLKYRLETTRQSMDRLEEILADLGMLKAKCRQMVDDLQETYEQAWTAVMQNTRVGDFSSAKERDATYASGAVEERLRLRRGQRILDDISSVHEFCNIKFRGLSSSQRDTESRIRLFNVESMLER